MNRLLIRNALILDGSGADPFPGDVLIDGGVIAAVGKIKPTEGFEELDAGGRHLTPGFVDIHRHADLQALDPSFGEAELRQGITACVSGNCGMSAAPCPPGMESSIYGYLEPCLGRMPEGGFGGFASFYDYTQKLSASSLPLNMGAYVGSGTVRIAVKGFDPGPMTPAEMDQAVAYISEAMQAGAAGLSMGLMYAPECNYSTDELVRLASAAGKHGGVLAVHVRGEGCSLVTSIEEAIAVAGKAEMPLNISHLKAAGHSNWGRALLRAIERIEAARAQGQDVTCDAYPYAAGATMLVTLLPPSLLAGGMADALERLKSPAVREQLREELSSPGMGWDNLAADLGWDRVAVSGLERPENREFTGFTVSEIAARRGMDEIDCVCDLLVSERGRAGMILHCMAPEDVDTVLRLPYCSAASHAIYPSAGLPHPRLYGAFPRVLRDFVHKRGVLTLSEAVRKMTSLPASRMGLKNRGFIRPGYAADLLLFRSDNILDTATYADPKRFAAGMDWVFVGGKAVISDGIWQGNKNGIFLRKGVSICNLM